MSSQTVPNTAQCPLHSIPPSPPLLHDPPGHASSQSPDLAVCPKNLPRYSPTYSQALYSHPRTTPKLTPSETGRRIRLSGNPIKAPETKRPADSSRGSLASSRDPKHALTWLSLGRSYAKRGSISDEDIVRGRDRSGIEAAAFSGNQQASRERAAQAAEICPGWSLGGAVEVWRGGMRRVMDGSRTF